MSTNLFFLFIFIYHILVVFQGLDFNDEGFHVAFYQQIFNDPESVQYAFWMWLTGIIGGVYMKLFPFLGLWGIRLAGAIVSTCTIVLAYNLLKRYLNVGWLRVSMIMLTFFINEDAKNLYYNNLSAFFYFLIAYFLFTGLRDNKKMMIFASGFFVCLNIFTRIPNVLGIAIIVSIFYYGYITKSNFKWQISRLGLFLGGFSLAAIVVFASMKYLGHLDLFLNSIKTVFASSQEAKKGDGIGGAYGIFRLLSRNLEEYGRSIRAVLLIALVILFIGFVNYLGTLSRGIGQKLVRLFNYSIVVTAIAFVILGWFNSHRLLLFFTGISLTSALLLFDKTKSADFKLLVFLGGLILLIHPFGSSEGISTVVVYSLWISFPIAIDSIAKIRSANLEFMLGTFASNFSLKSKLTDFQVRSVRLVSLSIITLACLYNVIFCPYLCDKHSRMDMTHSVDNKYMKGVFTSQGRVNALNELLAASSKYVKPNDYVLAYDCMPMYHYMTETRSYVRNPCIWFYSSDLFLKELNYAESHKMELPVVVRQNILTTGVGSSWPEIKPGEDYANLERNKAKNRYLNDFLKRNNYKEVWDNHAFTILIPQKEVSVFLPPPNTTRYFPPVN